MIDEFYQTLSDFLGSGRRCCQRCGERLWVSYAAGHMADVCLICPFEHVLDPATYVLDQPVPIGPLPADLEVINVPGSNQWRLPHETQYYRLRLRSTND